MKWIVEILEVNPYEITTVWNDGKIRPINLQSYLEKYKNKPNSSYHKLLDKEVFSKVKCDGTTLFWPGQIDYKDIDGSIQKGDLDISPEILYEITQINYKNAV